MANVSNIRVPKIDPGQLQNEKYTKQIVNYLLQLEESIRYMFANIDDDNVTKHFVDTLTVRNLEVTNNDNSMIIRPDIGIEARKGLKPMFSFDIMTGEVEFEGKVTANSGYIGGWEIDGNGLTSRTQDATINLYNDNNHAMELGYNGLHLYNHYSGSNEYLGGLVATYNPVSQENGLCIVKPASAEYLAIGYSYDTDNSNDELYIAMFYSKEGFTGSQGTYKPGFTFLADIDTKGYDFECGDLLINGYIPLTTYNYLNYVKTSLITPDLTAAGNINFAGSENAAGVNWVQANYYTQSYINSNYYGMSSLYTKSESDSRYAYSSTVSGLSSRVYTLEQKVAALEGA